MAIPLFISILLALHFDFKEADWCCFRGVSVYIWIVNMVESEQASRMEAKRGNQDRCTDTALAGLPCGICIFRRVCIV